MAGRSRHIIEITWLLQRTSTEFKNQISLIKIAESAAIYLRRKSSQKYAAECIGSAIIHERGICFFLIPLIKI
jgi:hypothetical protein